MEIIAIAYISDRRNIFFSFLSMYSVLQSLKYITKRLSRSPRCIHKLNASRVCMRCVHTLYQSNIFIERIKLEIRPTIFSALTRGRGTEGLLFLVAPSTHISFFRFSVSLFRFSFFLSPFSRLFLSHWSPKYTLISFEMRKMRLKRPRPGVYASLGARPYAIYPYACLPVCVYVIFLFICILF